MDTAKDKSPEATGLRALLNRLTARRVDLMPSHARQAPAHPPQVAGLETDANVASSQIAGTTRHMVVLDIDHPTYLVRSSTPGHYHLYIDVPGGIDGPGYENLLKALAMAGVVEQGYVSSAIERGWSAVRLPWVKKTAEEQAAAQQAAAQQAAAQQAAAQKQAAGPQAVPDSWFAAPSVPRGGLRWPSAKGDAQQAVDQRNQQAAAARRAALMFTDVDENGDPI